MERPDGEADVFFSRTETESDVFFSEMDAVLRRKRIPCQLKLEQLDRFLEEVELARGRAAEIGVRLDEALRGIDLDSVFAVEKRDRGHRPAERAWYNVKEWGA